MNTKDRMSKPRYFTLRLSNDDNPLGSDWVAVSTDTGEIIARSFLDSHAARLAAEQGFVHDDSSLPDRVMQVGNSCVPIIWFAIVIKNAHRLLRSKYRGLPLWSLVADLTGYGSTSSATICRQCGFDPHQKCGPKQLATEAVCRTVSDTTPNG